MCVCVCVRERERERGERDGDNDEDDTISPPPPPQKKKQHFQDMVLANLLYKLTSMVTGISLSHKTTGTVVIVKAKQNRTTETKLK